MTLQQIMPDTSHMRNTLAVSPARDLAHILPLAAQYAADFTREQLLTQEFSSPLALKQLDVYCQEWKAWFEACVDIDINNLEESYKAAGFDTTRSDYVGQQFNKWLIRVLVGMYFRGVREAKRQGEDPYGWEHVRDAVEAVRQEHGHECHSLFERVRRAITGKFRYCR